MIFLFENRTRVRIFWRQFVLRHPRLGYVEKLKECNEKGDGENQGLTVPINLFRSSHQTQLLLFQET